MASRGVATEGPKGGASDVGPLGVTFVPASLCVCVFLFLSGVL